MLQAIKFSSVNGTLEVLDQLMLPHTMNYVRVACVEDAWNVINKMQVGKLKNLDLREGGEILGVVKEFRRV